MFSYLPMLLLLLHFLLQFAVPLAGLSEPNAVDIEWLRDIQYDKENWYIFGQDFVNCMREMEWYGENTQDFTDYANFPEKDALAQLVRANPVKAVLSILKCRAAKCDTLTLNHYNVLFQCLAQQRDNTPCCVHKFKEIKLPRDRDSVSFLPKKGEKEALRVTVLEKNNFLLKMIELLKAKEIDPIKGPTPEQILKWEPEVMLYIQKSLLLHPSNFECLKLCNAEFPMNPWFYFPLIRSGACKPMLRAVSYCLVPFGVIADRSNNFPGDFWDDNDELRKEDEAGPSTSGG